MRGRGCGVWGGLLGVWGGPELVLKGFGGVGASLRGPYMEGCKPVCWARWEDALV